MTKRTERYRHPPRGMLTDEVGPYLGKSIGWFLAYRAALEAQGFPKRDPLIGGYDKHAIDAWLDRRSGLAAGDGIDWDAEMERRLEEAFPDEGRTGTA